MSRKILRKKTLEDLQKGKEWEIPVFMKMIFIENVRPFRLMATKIVMEEHNAKSMSS